jgi:hypothetical protein
LNIIGHTQDIDETRNHLKTEFEMKDLGKTKFCLDLQIEHLHSGILVHQSIYVQKILEKFNMDKAHPIKTPMVVRSLEKENDIFRPREEGKRYWDHSIRESASRLLIVLVIMTMQFGRINALNEMCAGFKVK